MSFTYFVATLVCLMTAADIGRSFRWAEYDLSVQRLFMVLTLPAAIGMWAWGIYGLWQLPWWQGLGGCVLTFFLVVVMHTKLVGSLWVNHWAMGLSVLGVVLMAAHFLG